MFSIFIIYFYVVTRMFYILYVVALNNFHAIFYSKANLIESDIYFSEYKLKIKQIASADSAFPDGVDPSFLAALPDNIRQEVIAEQLRLNRIQQSAREQAQNAQSTGSMEVNAEFLAALPPGIQEEVTMVEWFSMIITDIGDLNYNLNLMLE